MTVAEHLRKEAKKAGILEGIAQGEQQGLAKGKQAGLVEGKQAGLVEAAITIAKNMLAKGLDIDLIQSTTNLSEEEIKKLIH